VEAQEKTELGTAFNKMMQVSAEFITAAYEQNKDLNDFASLVFSCLKRNTAEEKKVFDMLTECDNLTAETDKLIKEVKNEVERGSDLKVVDPKLETIGNNMERIFNLHKTIRQKIRKILEEIKTNEKFSV
jgi:predicted transcriptional regulator